MYTNIVLNVKTKTKDVVNMYLLENSMNNFLSNGGLIDARMRASEKDLPVTMTLTIQYHLIII